MASAPYFFKSNRMIYIATDRRVIRDYELISDIGILWKYDRKTKSFPKVSVKKNDIVFSLAKHFIPEKGIIINTNEAKAKATDKGLTRKILHENGIPTPKTWYKLSDAKIPYIARPQYHSFGNGFHLITNESEHKRIANIAKDGWYFSEIFDIEKEYRVIVFGDEILTSFRKDIKGLDPKQTVIERARLRRKETNNNPRSELIIEAITPSQAEMCIASVKALGLDYAGVDLFVNGDNAVICEVNSEPTIRSFFADKIKDKIKNFKR
jgi:glutathione synthase/RimK-type ligase-like ATP-grasp enzyme